MKAIYLNVNENQLPEVIDIPDELETYYKLCQCTCIDIVTRKIGKNPYRIVCDDEGLFVDSPKISAIDETYQPQLVGNLVICGMPNDDGELTELTDKDVINILPRIRFLHTTKHPDGYYILTISKP